jgi:LPXTG-motif cell wall-anchored protein
MKVSRSVFAVVCLGFVLVFAARPARADKEWRSPLTLGEATEIPGMLLEPGNYIVKVVDTQETRKVVQFLSADETRVYATVMAVPDYRVTTTGHGEFVYFQRAEGRPQALKSWFYPANNYGIEFVYPKVTAVQIAEASRQPVYAAESAKPEAKEEVVAVTPEKKEVPVKVEAPPPPPAPAPPSTTLPKTGSDLPLIALAGLAAIGAGVGLRLLRRG